MSPRRPFVLDPLFTSVAALPGVGPKTLPLFAKLTGGERTFDLALHLPVDLIERRYADSIASVLPGETVIVNVIVDQHTRTRRGLPHRVRVRDDSGFLELTFFNAHSTWLEKQYPLHEKILLTGRVEAYRDHKQIAHPEVMTTGSAPADRIEVVYPLTAGITNRALRRIMLQVLDRLPVLPEWLDPAHKKQNGWHAWHDSLTALHHPRSPQDLEILSPERRRLAYDELLANQLALLIVRDRQKKQNGRVFPIKGPLRRRLESALPWRLTHAQNSALSEIDADMASPYRMSRLLQGDVGSGKTIVAALAMLNAVDGGAQAALMAPTEILARQHAATLQPFLDAAGIPFIVLTGRDKGKTREKILTAIASGDAKIVIGTHSLFQDSIDFQDLGLAVIDEQHRFGVEQRLRLADKTRASDILAMTATPIPRTLALTAYGDMDSSRIGEKPPGRKPIDTRLIAQDHVDELIAGLKRQIESGARVYWVCPLVEESETSDLAAAQKRFQILEKDFAGRIGLIHGRMKPAEKDLAMARFAQGETRILVATTVIEVGVNVPEATVMVIEHAERFGLAQLHQLRGRVGRGEKASFCFLVYAGSLTAAAKERLQVMRATEDGFLIAEKDLDLRGGGEILGTKQSGLPEFRIADLTVHADLLVTARDDAKLIISRDPSMQNDRGKALRTLLYLFERDAAIAYLRSG